MSNHTQSRMTVRTDQYVSPDGERSVEFVNLETDHVVWRFIISADGSQLYVNSPYGRVAITPEAANAFRAEAVAR